MESVVRSFPLAPMSRAVRGLTLALIGLPLLAPVIAVLLGSSQVPLILLSCGSLGVIYGLVWLWSRLDLSRR